MLVFGEGDYIVPVLAILEIGCVVLGLHFYRTGSAKTLRRSTGLYTVICSTFLALIMIALTASFAIGGAWRWSPPAWW
jgi:hypothetical protein